MLSAVECMAQSVTNSPYSRYGVGDISYMGTGHNIGMGGTSAGESTPFHVNTVNPACNTSLQMQRFLFDVGFDVKYTTTSSAVASQKNCNSTFKYLAGAFSAKPWWYFAFCFKPYSSVGYSFTDSTKIQYDGQDYGFREHFDGQGGLNKMSISTAFKVFKMVSFGATGSVIFGDLERNHTISSLRSEGNMNNGKASYTSTIAYKNNYIIHGMQADLGVRIEKSFRSKKDTLRDAFAFSLGAYLGNQANLKSRNELFVYRHSNTAFSQSAFSSIQNSDTLANDTLSQERVVLPKSFGVGLSLEFMERITVNADYHYQDWSGFTLPGESASSQMGTSKYMAIGMQYVTAKYSSSKWYRTINYRIGAHKQDTYIKVGGYTVQDKGLTMGVGFPIRGLILNVGCDFGKRGTTEHNLYMEKYCLMHFNVTVHDIWFQKRKFQ
ncbi:MAG: hypothetical protein MJZ61_05315 [Bacteroidales bacterium]|nr:hypothetical protein [Bacteroidales bacterium]